MLVEGPLETADFLAMAEVLNLRITRGTDITEKDHPVPRTRSNEVIIPRQRSNPRHMPIERPHQLLLLGVVYLDLAHGVPDCDLPGVLRPTYTSDLLAIRDLAELIHLGVASTPDVHRVVKSNSQDVIRRPVQEI